MGCSVTLEEARELEVKATQKLLEKVNQHEKIRPFLREYPFQPARATISISFRQGDDGHQMTGVALVFQVKNKIFYFKRDPSDKSNEEIYSETFEKAAKIVAQNPPYNFKLKKVRV